ncbi:MAG: TetR/AcrR family transcriptional regulator C-terminal domain-containing protein [Acidimicrobiaceae bacterium]|nr:TetR/AcrR family transcriptional regulator C-terminal domain-containing protein [Acidimicrobiaceae bacterium]MBO0746826.1 TetR/AcrR family transcriptional regulator C-terminal domain-containing protein [Acidimicrobiaceae bacterium]
MTRRGPLSRQQIVDAALESVRAGQYEQMTIRSLAAGLGVAPMALYRHVRDKDDLLVEVTDRLLAESWRPRARAANWKPWVTEVAERLRQLLVTQPAALHVYLRQPVTSPAAIVRMDATLEVLGRAGLTPDDASHAFGAIQTFTIGFAALEASRLRWRPDPGVVDPTAERLAAFTRPGQFLNGLHLLLDGIERGITDPTA